MLAAVETVLATAVSIWLVVALQTWWHVFLAAAVAPLLMLRSEASVQRGAERFEAWQARRLSEKKYGWPLFSLYPKLLIAALWIRFFSTLRFLHHGAKRLPKNYVTALLQSDLSQGVSLVPSTERLGRIVDQRTDYGDLGWKTLGWSAFFVVWLAVGVLSLNWLDSRGVSSDHPLPGLLIFFLLGPPAYFLFNVLFSYAFFVFAAWLRLSVKSTALIWLPIFYLATRMPRGPAQTSAAIEEEREGAIPSLLRVVAWLSLAFFCWRALIFPSTYDWWAAQPWAEVLLIAILPLGTDASELSLWHIASALSAALTLGFFYLLWDKSARRIAKGKSVSTGVTATYGVVFWVRGILSLYVIACSLYFAALGSRLVTVPDVSWCLFPWLEGCR